MQYVLLFLEGIITFISPCILPMLPLYISYFAGDNGNVVKSKYNALINSLGFVLGFTIIFTLLGTLAGTFGSFIKEQSTVINVLGGFIVVLMGLNYIGIIKIKFLQRSLKINAKIKAFKFISSVLFGMIFAIGWTPCVGAFLGTALMIAVNSQDILKGTLMLLIYSIGLGIPFVICAILIDRLKGTFNFIKRNYKVINRISGIILVIIGISITTGYLNKVLSFLTF
ncbi:cytochrome c biogenesis CcdA family protein [Clostridium vincentii]|uniref:Thiol:disulfide interchange protein DsbD n=1 Tax=Clostridium vincentii TaxID=52704 RepID=A0A2T0B930_9CLOT|nr:cytochrome c biogenesis protein CcdA [Clostridium vincentii]PRR80384.1 Thiol:disulfide interchange protein DsbD precursor [Clostridium vincentii]